MPYTYAKQGSKYAAYKEKKGGERGEKVGSTEGTKEALKKYLAALHANETTNENIMNFASKAERFFMPKDKNMKFKEDLQDLYYTDRDRYFKVKSYYMDQVGADRQSADIQAVMDAFKEIERGLNEATSEEDRKVFDAIKTAGFKSWEYDGDPSGEVFYAKGRDVGEAARYLRYKHKLQKIDLSKITPTGLGAGITDNALVAIYTNKDIYEMTGDKSKMKNKLKSIVKELMAPMPPPPMYAPIKSTDASPIVKAIENGQLDLRQITNISTYLSKRTAFQPSVKDGELGAAIVDFLNKNEVPNQILQPIIDQLPKQDVMYTGPGMRENVNENKNKMKVNQLKQIIREEIAKVLNEGMDDSRFFDPFSPEYKERERGAVTRQGSQMTIELPSTERGAESGQYTIDQSGKSQKLASALMKIGNAGAGMISLDNLQSFADMFGSSDTFMNWLAQTDGMKFKVTMPRSGAIQLRKIA